MPDPFVSPPPPNPALPFGKRAAAADSNVVQFFGSIAGDTLTLEGPAISGAVASGQTVDGKGVSPGTVIGPGSALTWKVSPSQTVVGPVAMTATSSTADAKQVAFEAAYSGRLDHIERLLTELVGVARGDLGAPSGPSTAGALPNGKVGTPYSASVGGSVGTAPYKWALTAGTLPAGLTLNAATGAITGTPTAVASAPLTFTVTDASLPAAASAMVTTSLAVTA